jgi:Zn-dependent protease
LNSNHFFGNYSNREQERCLTVPPRCGTDCFRKDAVLDSLYVLPILLFSIVVHEVAHGWVALQLGDSTARDFGRLTLNPIPHLDPIGSIAIPLLSFISAGSIFIAWAKPVPVNPANFSNFRRDDTLVSIVGPLSNLLVAFGCVIFYILSVRFIGPIEQIGGDFQREIASFIIRMFAAGITLNIFLAVFNMIPVPPLDGSHILAAWLPDGISDKFRQIGFFGILIVILLMRLDPFRNFILSVVLIIRIPFEFLIQQFI